MLTTDDPCTLYRSEYPCLEYLPPEGGWAVCDESYPDLRVLTSSTERATVELWAEGWLAGHRAGRTPAELWAEGWLAGHRAGRTPAGSFPAGAEPKLGLYRVAS